jgi:hypothetical protein
MTLTARIDALLIRLGLSPTQSRRQAVKDFHEAATSDRAATRGAQGGGARAANMKPQDRSESAQAAAVGRWAKWWASATPTQRREAQARRERRKDKSGLKNGSR